jgi:hypothetical protein
MNMASRASGTTGRRSKLARPALFAAALVATAGLGLLVSACGGSSSGEGVAQVETTQATTDASTSSAGSRSASPAAYSACMRRNGVPKFPDPDANGGISIIGGPGLDPNSPQFKAAERACEKLLPRGGGDQPDATERAKAQQEALAYSACMRKNGVPSFPDPKTNAEGGLDLNAAGSDFDPSSPQYKKAEKACRELLPGGPGANRISPAPGGTK